jgi:hypothetical protein
MTQSDITIESAITSEELGACWVPKPLRKRLNTIENLR